MMQAITAKLDTPVLTNPATRRWASWVVFVFCLMITVGSYSQFLAKENRVSAAAEKPVIQGRIDDSRNFGRCTVSADGKFISWNRGMTKLLGWRSKDMVGQTAERLNPHVSDEESTTFPRIFSRRAVPFVGYSTIHVLTKDGNVVNLPYSIIDTEGEPLFREITFGVDPRGMADLSEGK